MCWDKVITENLQPDCKRKNLHGRSRLVIQNAPARAMRVFIFAEEILGDILKWEWGMRLHVSIEHRGGGSYTQLFSGSCQSPTFFSSFWYGKLSVAAVPPFPRFFSSIFFYE